MHVCVCVSLGYDLQRKKRAYAVVIGSKIIRVLQGAQPGQELENLMTFMRSILGDTCVCVCVIGV